MLDLDLNGYMTPEIEEVYHLHIAQNNAAIAPRTTPGQFGILAPIAAPVPTIEPPIEGMFNEHSRPPGTPKSDDPNKKKRKWNARQRDLCDVKIKITEYFPGTQQGLDIASGLDVSRAGQRLWTIQRVNGNGGNGGNGKGDGVAGPHKHTLERSDEIKNSVQRYLANQEDVKKDKEKVKDAARRSTGAALITAREHGKENELKFYASCFCLGTLIKEYHCFRQIQD
ncbi:glutathione S-transferase omega-1 [Fusarium beomiforme]|uniref:Glutathione S-transferase omega-1 n=1 Tax=Fusarium beomiforme TaxID=44412 RepID=A0A9P5DVL5_9HYPO|nr:glutathione S-transferase omega-1 [Fusarium beomiforme]